MSLSIHEIEICLHHDPEFIPSFHERVLQTPRIKRQYGLLYRYSYLGLIVDVSGHRKHVAHLASNVQDRLVTATIDFLPLGIKSWERTKLLLYLYVALRDFLNLVESHTPSLPYPEMVYGIASAQMASLATRVWLYPNEVQGEQEQLISTTIGSIASSLAHLQQDHAFTLLCNRFIRLYSNKEGSDTA